MSTSPDDSVKVVGADELIGKGAADQPFSCCCEGSPRNPRAFSRPDFRARALKRA